MVTVSRPELSANALRVMEERLLWRDATGTTVVETPDDLFWRVATALSAVEERYGTPAADQARLRQAYFEVMRNLEFLPNSPTLGNAGKPDMCLSACFVLPVPDSLEGIFDAMKHAALVHQAGGGTGFSFSRLRPAGSVVRSTSGVASGPVSFMKVFDGATEAIKQGGSRRGANMGILRVDHPDIDKFIALKSDRKTLQNFNISVAVTDVFMQAVMSDSEYDIIDPQTGDVVERRRARVVWDHMIQCAWLTGDPGVFFIDRVNNSSANPVPDLGPIESSNPCGEQALQAFDSCNLGSIDVGKFVRRLPEWASEMVFDDASDFDVVWQWVETERLERVARVGTFMLDSVIDANHYPLPQIAEVTRRVRRIGLGPMGLADLLFRLHVPYGSPLSFKVAEQVMGVIARAADEASRELAARRGAPGPFDQRWVQGERRNGALTTGAPTGTLSILADCNGGIEPAFNLVFIRQHRLRRDAPLEVTPLVEVNSTFRETAEECGFASPELFAFLAGGGRLVDRPEVPAWVKEVYVTAHELVPEQHIRMQAAIQKKTDGGVSKTLNFPHNATLADVEHAYLLAYQEGCRGATIYRDGSLDQQVLTHGTVSADMFFTVKPCPECSRPMAKEDCWKCADCGVSLCAT